MWSRTSGKGQCLRSNMALRSREALISWKAFMLLLRRLGSSSCRQYKFDAQKERCNMTHLTKFSLNS